MKNSKLVFISLVLFSVFSSCSDNQSKNEMEPSNPSLFSDYWYDGQAEISSYKLKQERYGEIREGNAVMIFVTEPYSKIHHTKADEEGDDNISVMKMNYTKNFVTGIYPYSLMTSVFYPLDDSEHAIKLTNSTQEWCGQTFMELKRESDFDICIKSYFQEESKDHHHEEVSILEDEIWTMIRVRPHQLPEGQQRMIPGFNYLRLEHKALKQYDCVCVKTVKGDTSIYSISYPELERDLEVCFQTEFPHKILKWKDVYPCGSCEAREKMESSGVIMETMKVDYWNKNSKADTISRIQLGLH